MLVVLAALSDGRKVVLAVVPGHRKSTASWAAVLRDLKERGLRAPPPGDRRWPLGHLGRPPEWVSGSGRTALLEPQNSQCAREDPEGAAGHGPSVGVSDPLCRDRSGGGTPTGAIRALVSSPGIRPSRRLPDEGLGPDAHLLSVSEGSLAASPHNESGGIALCGRAPSHGCGEPIQEGGQCNCGDLENAHGCGTSIPLCETSRIDAGSLSRYDL